MYPIRICSECQNLILLCSKTSEITMLNAQGLFYVMSNGLVRVNQSLPLIHGAGAKELVAGVELESRKFDLEPLPSLLS